MIRDFSPIRLAKILNSFNIKFLPRYEQPEHWELGKLVVTLKNNLTSSVMLKMCKPYDSAILLPGLLC